MNWKQILYKGLPVFLIAAVLVIGAAILSRPKPQPKVTNSKDTVLDFKNLNITKGDLYEMMKNNTGLSTLINEVDRDLLAEYNDKVDTEAVEDKISSDKKTQGEEAFYQSMIFQGVISSEEDPDADEKIKDYYLLSFLQKAYAKDIAIAEINDEEATTHAIQNAKDSYHEDMCIITLKYDSKNEAFKIKDKLTEVTNILQFFKDEYAKQHINDETTDDETTVEEPAFIVEFNCEYDRAVYTSNLTSPDFRDFIFKDTINEEAFGIGDYNKDPQYIPSDETYYFVYKVSKPQYIENYRESEEFTQYILDDLVSTKLTSTYILDQISDLRKSINLRIFDTEMAEQYRIFCDLDFEPELDYLKIENGEHIVASYNIDGSTKYVYADDLYETMKIRYSMQLLLDKINNEALKSIPEIQLSISERKEIEDLIENYKAQYIQQQQTYSWTEYIALYFGVFSEEQLIDILAGPKLVERYLLGYEDFEGVSTVKEEDITKAYNEWFNIEASHMLFTFNPEDKESKALALEKGKQVINGCTDNGEFREGIDENTCYIYYDPEDSTNTALPFAGLDEIEASQYINAFEAIAKKYSQDPSAVQNGGALGFFGPKKMVVEFENAAKEIASRIEEGGVPFTLIPVESTIYQIGQETHGFHVIYVTDSDDKPILDESEQVIYDQYILDLEDDEVTISENYTTDQITKFNAFKAFRETLESDLGIELRTPENEHKMLAELRDSTNFHFNDPEMQAIYENVNTMQKAYRTEDTE